MKRLLFWQIPFLYLVLFATVGYTGVWKSVANRAGLEIGRPDEISDYYKRLVLVHSRWIAQVPAGSILFIGNSITHGLCVTSVDPLSINLGIGGDTTAGVLQRLDGYRSAINKARKVVLEIGVNDLQRRSNEEVIRNYELILNQLSEVNVLSVAILPVDERLMNKKVKYQTRIADFNKKLEELVARYPNCQFVDFTSSFDKDNDGRLDEELHSGDGIHLNEVGSDLLVACLKKVLQEEVDIAE